MSQGLKRKLPEDVSEHLRPDSERSALLKQRHHRSSPPSGMAPPPPPPVISMRMGLPNKMPPVMAVPPAPSGQRPRAPPPTGRQLTIPPRPPSMKLPQEQLAVPSTTSSPLASSTSSKGATSGGPKLAIKLAPKVKPSSIGVTSKRPVPPVFGNDSDSSEEEEMPQEAKMRMKNIGRDTITSSGPNSFGKTRQGFVDSKKLFERQMQQAMDEVCDEDKK